MSEEIKDDLIAEESVVEETNTVEEVVSEDTNESPLTVSRTISAINAELSEMSKEDLDAILEASKDKAKVESDDDEEEDGDEDEGEVETEKKEKKEKKEAKDNFKEDLDVLVKGEDSLSEGFKDKASTIFEAALHSKVSSKITELEERYASDLEGEVNAIKEDLVDKVDGYLNHVVENWMKENEVAIEHSLKSEITESFIDAMHGVFAEHYINVPEDKVDILDALTEEVNDVKEQLNKETEIAKDLSEKVKSFERAEIVTEACEGLAATEAAKLFKLTEGIDASDNEEFASKVTVIKESYMNAKDTEVKEDSVDAINETSNDEDAPMVTDEMSKYLDALKQK